jgi:hypothetical protein
MWTGEEFVLWSGRAQPVPSEQLAASTLTGERLSF